MAIISSGIITLTDLNDAIISGTKPVNPTAGTLWIDTSINPAILKVYKNGIWAPQDLDLESLDPDMAQSIKNVVETIGNMSNDNILDVTERKIIKDDLSDIIGKVMGDTETVLPTVAQLETLMKGSFYSTRQSALNAGVDKENSIYVDVSTQYQNLKTYLESMSPVKPWDSGVTNQSKNITVVKTTFRDKWLQYYLATEKLNLTTAQKIKDSQQELDDKVTEVSLRDKTEILSGTEIFTDKADDAVVHVEIDGKSEQEKDSSNLFDIQAWLSTPTSEKLSSNGVPYISLKLEPSTNYTVTTNIPNRGALYDVFVMSAHETASSTVNGIALNSPRTIQTKNDGMLNVAMRDYSLDKKSGYWIKVEKETASSPTTFKGYSTPTPDYPVPINSLNNFDVVSSVGKENLYKGGTSLETIHIINLASNGRKQPLKKGRYIFSIKEYQGVTKYRFMWALFKNGIKITEIDQTPTHLQTTSHSIYYNGTYYLSSGDTSNKVVEVVLDDDYELVWGFGYGDATSNSQMLYPKIELGVENTEYSQSPSDIQPDTPNPTTYKTNISLPEPLRSIGDVKDRLFRDTDGLWKVERKVGEESLSGTSNFSTTNTTAYNGVLSTNMWLVPKQRMLGDPNKNIERTTHFIHINQVWDSPNDVDMGGTSLNTQTQFHIRVPNRLLGVTIEDSNSVRNQKYKNWFEAQKIAGTPVIVQYPLANPTIETLPDDMQQKLNNIQSYKGSNYVYTVLPDKSDILSPNLRATFKSNMWYRLNVLNENIDFGNRNWARNGNFAYKPEDSAWKDYYKGTTRAIADISSEAPPFKNALQIQQTTSGISGIVDAVIWEGASAKELVGKKVSMATWLKYQNIANSELVMQLQVTGKKADGTFVYDYPKIFAHTGTDLSWKRHTGTIQINMPAGAVEVTRIVFRLGLSKAGTGTFWATGIQIQTGSVIGEWNLNPQDVELEFEKTEARFILTEKEIGLSVKKGELINGLFVNGDGTKITGEHFQVDSKTTFKDDLTMNAGRIKSKDGGISIDLNEGTMNLSRPLTINAVPVLTETDLNELELKDGKSAYEIAVGNGFIGSESQWLSSLKGLKGDTGTSVKSVTEYYLASSSSTGVITSTAGWTTTIQTMTIDKKYLWNYEKVTFSDNTSQNTVPVVIGVYGDTGATGATGRSITGVSEYYLATNSASGVNRLTAGWTLTMQTTTPTKKYLWNYETITWSSAPTITYVEPIIIGIHGDQGIQGERGISISNVDVEYAQSTSATVAPTTGWSTTAPVWKDGQYIWSRTKTAYSTGNPTYSTPVCITGQKGATGTTGSAGRGITSINEQYYLSNSKTVQSGGEWVESPPTWISGRYMWTRSKIAYNNPYNIEYTTAVVDSAWEALEGVTLKDKDYQIGTEVFTDKADEAVVHVEIEGKSYQNSGSGKNIFLSSKVPEDKLRTTIADNKEVFINNDIQGKFYTLQGELNKQYTFTFEYKHIDGKTPMYVKFYYSDGTDDGTSQGACDSKVWTKKSITSAVNKTVIGIGYEDTNTYIEWRPQTIKETVSYTTSIVYDNTLNEGTRNIRTQGINGIVNVVKEYEYVNNVASGKEREVSRIVEIAMVPEVVVVGTRKLSNVTYNFTIT